MALSLCHEDYVPHVNTPKVRNHTPDPLIMTTYYRKGQHELQVAIL